MKSLNNILGTFGVVLLFIGIIFKLFHFPGASLLLLIGGTLGTLFFLLSLTKRESDSKNIIVLIAEYFLSLTMAITLIGFVFKSMKYPGASILTLVSTILLIILVILLIVAFLSEKEKKNLPIVKLLFSFMFIAAFPIFLNYMTPKKSNDLKNLKAVVAVDKMNVLYKGIDNPITVAVPDSYLEILNFEINGGEIVEVMPGKYNIKPNKKELTIRIFANKNGDTIDFGTTKFRVHDLPIPTVFIAGQNGDYIKWEDFKNNPSIETNFENFLFQLDAPKIVSYEISVGDFVGKVEGSRISDNILNEISNMQNDNTLVVITNLLIQTDDGTKSVPEIRFHLVP